MEDEENMSSPPVDPLQLDSLVQPLVEELAITRSPSSSEGEVEQVTFKHFLIMYMCSCHVCCCSILWRKGEILVNRFAAISCETSLNFNKCSALSYFQFLGLSSSFFIVQILDISFFFLVFMFIRYTGSPLVITKTKGIKNNQFYSGLQGKSRQIFIGV